MTTRTAQDDETARLRADIARTRARLAESVDALTARLDVPGRVHDAAARRVAPVRRLAGGAVAAATTVTGVAVTTITGVAVTAATTVTGVAVTAATTVSGVAWGLTKDGAGIGLALVRWSAGTVGDTVSAVKGFTRRG